MTDETKLTPEEVDRYTTWASDPTYRFLPWEVGRFLATIKAAWAERDAALARVERVREMYVVYWRGECSLAEVFRVLG